MAATSEELIVGAENLLTIGIVTEPTLDEGENSSTTVFTISTKSSRSVDGATARELLE